jgi:hypothetical protein
MEKFQCVVTSNGMLRKPIFMKIHQMLKTVWGRRREGGMQEYEVTIKL